MMFKNDNVKIQEFVYDFDVDGGVKDVAIDLSAKANHTLLPDNAIILEVYAQVVTAVTSGGSGTVEWGNTTATDGLSGANIAKTTLVADYVHSGATSAASQLWDDTNDHSIPFICNSTADRDFVVMIQTADLTAGKIVFGVMYLLLDTDQ